MKWTSVSTPAIRVTICPQSLCNCRPGSVSKRTVARLARSTRFGAMYRFNWLSPPL
jgi:hypothetical protein